jgi:ABC-type bacteriocin/lantibiotic exporter with double-glycine peptidase domain
VLRAERLSLGDLLALAALGAAATTPIASVLQAVQQLTLASAYLDRIRELFDADEDTCGTRTPTGGGELEVSSVTFSYGTSNPVLSRLSMHVAPGAMVGVVGASGSGKTTLVRLLAGLLRPTGGEVLLDGVPIAEVDRQTLYSFVAVVPQHPVVLSGSVVDNVAFGRPVDRARIQDALRQAALYDEVCSWRLGLDTPLGESGSRLSGGQRQRLVIARALYGCPRLLVLDEPTSGLDALTERVVQDSLREYGCTRIVISHRLATLIPADRIYVLDGGRMVDEGSADELGSRGGLYRRMAVQQGLVQPGPVT